MKRMTYFVMALALVLGLSQCKKEQPATPQNGQVRITLNVENGGNNGSRVNVNPTTSPMVTFEKGDQILVGYNGVYVGTLTHNGTQFEGSIDATQNGDQPLYFYFVGNKQGTLEAGAATSCTVSISDQTHELPVLSMGESINRSTGETVYYSSETTAYEAQLHNKCALVKFSTNVESRTVKVAGMSTVANIDFATGTITPDATTSGTVSFITDSQGEGWAILLEQGAVANAMVTATVDDTDKGCACSVPKITNNMFYSDGIQAELSAPTRSGILDAVSYAFYGDGTLYFSGSGTVPGNQFDYLNGVKKIIFDKNCTISKLNTYVYQHWNNPPLTDIEINTTVPLQLERFSIAWRMYSGTVNVTIKAPSLTLGKNATPFNCGSAVNIFIDVTEPITFEKNSMSLDNNAVVTIHSGCFCHVSGGIEFNDPLLQHEYEHYVDMGDDWELQEFLQDHQGDYTIVEESTSELTSENAHLVFGNATVIFI